ncbi:MAG: plasmid stabilization protein [Rhizobium rhizophilum]|uniref:plasmid stabilization protein n=1 Tax=Rhizobium rhizophilum TaxID=1850373 RepID=UPI00391D0253
MAKPQLSVRSAHARDLAHRLARRENRSIADIVERALEVYETQQTGREPAADFYRRISAQSGLDIDLDASIKADRQAHEGPEI